MTKKLLIPMDGSPQSFAACNYGVSLAKTLGAKVEVLFVVDRRKTQIPFIYAGGAYDIAYERIYIPPDQELKKFYDRLNQDLHNFADNVIKKCRVIAEEQGVEMEAQVRDGFPSHEIEDLAHSADMLVLGRRGENSEYKGETIGSTTEEVVRKSPRPVLICGEEPFKLPKKILVPYDASRSAENALQFYIGEFSQFAGKLLLLCAEGVEKDFSSFENELEYIRQHEVEAETIRDEQSPVHAIGRIAEENEVDLIIIGSHGRNKIVDYLLGSTTIHLLRNSTVPVLVVY
jgi:nucleotide-binding universal stress UspA family protein